MVIWEETVDYSTLKFTPISPPQGVKTRGEKLVAEVCAFDIEATRFEDVEQSAMYVWQFSIDNKLVIIGRTWQEFLHMLNELKNRLNGRKLIIFVHNLSYEFQFLAGIYSFSNFEVFATESRKVLKCTLYNTFEFRCSYRLFNMSLDAVTRKFNCKYRKRSGAEFNYEKKRISTTELSRKELLYCVYDVLGLVEAIKEQLKLYNDDLYTIPFTQTGYVRREAKRYMRDHHHDIQNTFPDLELFKVLRAAFRGGNTHCNRYFAGELLKKVHGNDVSSEYPAQQVLEKYPRGKFKPVGSASLTTRYIDKLRSLNKSIIMIVDFYNIKLRCWYDGFPYLPIAKAIGKPLDVQPDNGRVLSARYIRIALTDIDYDIITRQYIADRIEIVAAWSTNYGPMYDGIVQLNKELFIAKTELKGVKGQELYYSKAKEQLNSIYGMSCQNPLTTEVLFDYFLFTQKPADEVDVLRLAKKNAFLTYQLGVWTTANARCEIQKFIERAGENAVYCDTDSLIYLGEVDFSDYNKDYQQRCEKSGYGAFADDPNGKRHYMGVFESEDVPGAGCKFERFVSLGAKRYAFERGGSGELGITVSGVSKKAGAAELKRKGGLEAFRQGLAWEDSGKLEAIYNDVIYPELYSYDGQEIEFTPNVTLRPTSYTIKLTDDYADLIARCTVQDIEQGLADYRALKEITTKYTSNDK